MNKKFRAYYKPDLDEESGALKFEQTLIEDELFFVYDADIWYPFEIPFIDDQWVVQQYTGVKDKNETEIYEGDLIKYSNSRDQLYLDFVLEYSEQQARYVLVNSKYTFDLYNVNDYYGHVEIVGNIFENPELLEKK